MDEDITCPSCHLPISSVDYYCSNCGKKIRSRPLSTSFLSQIWLYIKTLLLPPFGFIWGYRYLQQSDTKSKLVGIFTIIITIIEVVWLIQTTVTTVNTVNQQIFQQVQLYGL